MGGASVATLAAGFLRAKVIAWVAGPAGVGLLGVCGGFSGNVATFAGWGLGTSGVRAIAAADEAARPAKIAAVRAFGRLLTWLGALLTLGLFWPVGWATFGSAEFAGDLLVAGLAAPLIIATAMWTAILQAHGQLKALALSQVATAGGGLVLGFDRETAARFSFLLSIPAVVLSGLFELRDIGGGDGTPILATIIATIFAFISGYASIAFLLRYLARHTLTVFGVYRILFGLLIFGLVLTDSIT